MTRPTRTRKQTVRLFVRIESAIQFRLTVWRAIISTSTRLPTRRSMQGALGMQESASSRHLAPLQSAAGLSKVIAVRESWRLRFESTFTNVLNRTNYAPPATNISNQASFGVLTAAQTAENAGNRTGQIALRLSSRLGLRRNGQQPPSSRIVRKQENLRIQGEKRRSHWVWTRS